MNNGDGWVLSWILENYEWLFGGAGVAVFAGAFRLILGRKGGVQAATPPVSSNSNVINFNPAVTVVNGVQNLSASSGTSKPGEANPSVRSRDDVKATTKILFVDDDTRFKVVKILKNSGWVQTSLVKDLVSLDEPAVHSADIIFVDIQGVGVALGFRDEGLGLAEALKDRHPDKRVVIYSAEPRGEMFHKALKKADASLKKNADPYEFERLIEGFVGLE